MNYQENQTTIYYHIQELTNEELLEIYRDTAPSHFPEDELKPISAIKALLDKDAFIGLGLFNEEDRLMGYALFLAVPGLDVILLDYYAILSSYRDLGLGSYFLQQIRTHFSQYRGIFIETEDIDCASNEEELTQRTRRNDFYRRNGAILTDIRCALFDVPFTIFFLETVTEPKPHTANSENISNVKSSGCEATAQLQEKLDKIYRFMLPPEVYTQNVTWSCRT